MATNNREREQLKSQGYVYDRHLGRWIHIDEQEKYYRTEKQAGTFFLIVNLCVAAGIFIWLFMEAGWI